MHSVHEVTGTVSEGDVLDGKYRIERVLGTGGMGVVVAARHIYLDEAVAIKFLLPEALGDREAVERFSREARAAVKIKSEHVARVTDVGVLASGAPYMVMEYLEGCDLSAWLQHKGPLPVEQAVEFVLQACEAIADAHNLGIVHRDLKPSNLYCITRNDGLLAVKVLDFGISKFSVLDPKGSDMAMTKTASIMGSPLYMSPEQMKSSRSVDGRTDIWALGIILYELLAGAPPFEGETLTEVCLKVASEEPPSLALRRPGIPDSLEHVILNCLRKNREDRYPNVAELAKALAPFGPARSDVSVERIIRIFQSGNALGAQQPPVIAGAAKGAPQQTQSAWAKTAAKFRANRVLAIAGVSVAALAGGLAIMALTRSSSKQTASAAAETHLPVSSSTVGVPGREEPSALAPSGGPIVPSTAPAASSSALPTADSSEAPKALSQKAPRPGASRTSAASARAKGANNTEASPSATQKTNSALGGRL